MAAAIQILSLSLSLAMCLLSNVFTIKLFFLAWIFFMAFHLECLYWETTVVFSQHVPKQIYTLAPTYTHTHTHICSIPGFVVHFPNANGNNRGEQKRTTTKNMPIKRGDMRKGDGVCVCVQARMFIFHLFSEICRVLE